MQIVGYVLACRSYSFVSTLHHLIIIIVETLSEDIELIKCLSDIICRVCKIKHLLSVIHYTICGAVCFQFTHFLCDDWENIYTLSNYHHTIGSMNYYPLFKVRSWNNSMRGMSFYILLESNTNQHMDWTIGSTRITPSRSLYVRNLTSSARLQLFKDRGIDNAQWNSMNKMAATPGLARAVRHDFSENIENCIFL